MVQTYLIHHFYSIYDVGNEHCSFRYLQIIFISSYTFYIENTIYRDNPPVSLTLTPSFTQGGLLSVQISNIYIGQNINIKADLLGPPMVDPTTVSHNVHCILQLEIKESFIYDDILNKFKISTTPSVFAYAKPPPSAREATKYVQFL